MDFISFLKPTWKKIGVFLAIVIFVSVTLYLTLGYPFWYAVTTEAMEPNYSFGDLVVVRKTSFDFIAISEVIVHKMMGSTPVIMRVESIDIEQRTYTTKGDNNLGIGNFQRNLGEDTVIAKVFFKLPLVGYLDIFRVGWLVRILIIYLISCLFVSYLSKQ